MTVGVDKVEKKCEAKFNLHILSRGTWKPSKLPISLSNKGSNAINYAHRRQTYRRAHTFMSHTHTRVLHLSRRRHKKSHSFPSIQCGCTLHENGPREWQKRSLLLWLVRSTVALIRHFIKESFAWVAVHLHDNHNRLPSIQHTHTARWK